MNYPTNIICHKISEEVFNIVEIFSGVWIKPNPSLDRMREHLEKKIRDRADDLIAWRFGQVQQEMDV